MLVGPYQRRKVDESPEEILDQGIQELSLSPTMGRSMEAEGQDIRSVGWREEAGVLVLAAVR